MSRPLAFARYYIVFLSEELGGENGMLEVVDTILEITKYRGILKPTDPSALLSEARAGKVDVSLHGQRVGP